VGSKYRVCRGKAGNNKAYLVKSARNQLSGVLKALKRLGRDRYGIKVIHLPII
jgi:hypothetical protein